MKKIDWEGACPPAPEGFTQAMNRALEKTRAVEKKRPAPLRRLALACSAALFLLWLLALAGLLLLLLPPERLRAWRAALAARRKVK